MKSRSFRFLLFAFLFLTAAGILLTPAHSAAAQTSTPPSDDAVNAIARKLYCPICENTPLEVCPTEACHQWRELIRQMLAEGKSEEEIIQYFVDNYGARVLPAPPAKGINWLAYIVPPVLFLGGVFLLFQAFRRWKRAAQETAAPAVTGEQSRTAADDSYAARLEAELKKRR